MYSTSSQIIHSIHRQHEYIDCYIMHNGTQFTIQSNPQKLRNFDLLILCGRLRGGSAGTIPYSTSHKSRITYTTTQVWLANLPTITPATNQTWLAAFLKHIHPLRKLTNTQRTLCIKSTFNELITIPHHCTYIQLRTQLQDLSHTPIINIFHHSLKILKSESDISRLKSWDNLYVTYLRPPTHSEKCITLQKSP